MSYDLMVFNPDAAPKTQPEFLTWFEEVTEWEDDGIYDNPGSAHPKLYQWYKDMQAEFPDMNGDYSDEYMEGLGSKATGYSIAANFIYTDFRWSVAEEAFDAAVAFAEKHGLGFFDPQSETVYFTGADINTAPLPQQQEKKKPWWKIW